MIVARKGMLGCLFVFVTNVFAYFAAFIRFLIDDFQQEMGLPTMQRCTALLCPSAMHVGHARVLKPEDKL